MGTCMVQEQTLKSPTSKNYDSQQGEQQVSEKPKEDKSQVEEPIKPPEVVDDKAMKKTEEEASVAIQKAFRYKIAKNKLEEEKQLCEQDKPKDWQLQQDCFKVPTLPKIVDEKINRQATNDNRMLPAYVASDGTQYNGQWKLGVQSGYGQMLKPDGTYLEGQWKQGKLEDGATVYPNGDVFLGQAQIGVRVYKNGIQYSGDVLNGIPHGSGEELHPDGTKYDGGFIKGLKHGKGVVKFSNHSEYNGEYHNGEIEGKGTFKWADGATYTGDWKQSMMCGKGTFHFSDGRVYIGDFVEDKREGHGVMTYPDKSQYEGAFHNNKRNGMGKVATVDGQIIECEWRDDKLVLPPPSQ